ncbi:hypothetical protein EMIT07CA2_550066 [Brevibacillus sp. IT-7CA2]|uniref:transcription termination/antitermination NusG family protein n=1 Tax=Brevibacillus sp. IT-7CA2 TaxID=3026436 RepID=UPI0039E15A39
MSAIFAIQVLNGKEIHAKSEILRQMKNYGIQAIKDVIAFEVFTKRFRGKESAPTTARSIVPGYIFVEMDIAGFDLKQDGELWSFIKKIPFVQKILQYSIDEEEFESFFEVVTEETYDFEVAVKEEPEPDSLDHANALHLANTSNNPKDKRYWLQQLSRVGLLERLNLLKSKANSFLQGISSTNTPLEHPQKQLLSFIKHSGGWRKGKTPTFRFSGQLFVETRKVIDPNTTLSNSLLTTGVFIVPHIISYLEKHMNLLLSPQTQSNTLFSSFNRWRHN